MKRDALIQEASGDSRAMSLPSHACAEDLRKGLSVGAFGPDESRKASHTWSAEREGGATRRRDRGSPAAG
eukprot:CAMPEP_0168691348 /NCGR_PEP_ID=MMETSP0503-20121227/32643_1 /TAXON_ID=89963 /ORGANISM="Heterocapsa rotundata, Strain SCCAP K-0483" /LENGTH=69 /DNA_ID=CAMNT_0008736781 /DNA_START=62 /DNA_END=269 /DNA_ORIENTATION=-